MQPNQATITLLTRIYQGFNARDAEAVLAEMQPDVQWPKGFVGGYEHGRDAVRAYWTQQWTEIDPHVDPTGFELLPDGRVAVTVHQVVRALDGTLLMDVQLHHTYELRNGRIARMDIQAI
ncbi:MAG: nuclear transport factor 2 family protein [Hymenobacter sp.]|nr:MAG: nuclear transport factor 2 family protein [Hymenobacter sp.]